MNDLFVDHYRYSALSVAYAVAAAVSGFIPFVTALIGAASGEAWWHPGVVLALLSLVTLVSAYAAARMRHAPEVGDLDEAERVAAPVP
jgi:membrane protein implicated in regulation of membrane protease activity